VLKKPDAAGGQQSSDGVKNTRDTAMTAHEDELLGSLDHIIDRNVWWARHGRLRGFFWGVVSSIIATLVLRLAAAALPE
jgi:hypothetical protein